MAGVWPRNAHPMVTLTKIEAEDALPPSYTEAAPSPSSLPPPSPPPVASSSLSAPSRLLSPPTNYLTISRLDDSVKGKYTIDPSIRMPSSVIPSLGKHGRTLNAYLKSNNSIDVVIQLIRGPEAKGPAQLEALSLNGSVTVTVVSAPSSVP